MVISPPSINLRKTAAYYDRGPLSSTSSAFSLNYLASYSPPLSPSFSVLAPSRSRIYSSSSRLSRVFRILLWISGVTLLFYYTYYTITQHKITPWDYRYIQKSSFDYEIVSQDDFPGFPTPIAITDLAGMTKWTFWVPSGSDFPQGIHHYSDVVAKCHEVAAYVRDKNDARLGTFVRGIDEVDPSFVDVAEALHIGMLPGFDPARTQKKLDGLVGISEKMRSVKGCKMSMTFILESPNAGLGHTLMLLWIAYGVAQSQGRAFFIDDSRWAYGKYTDIFQLPPAPNCAPPLRMEAIPCPYHSRHIVVTSATAKETLEMALTKNFDDSIKMEMYRQRKMFDFARRGYEALFKLRNDDAKYVNSRIEELNKKRTRGKGTKDGLIVGVHIRRGDCHPIEYQYHDSYIPLNNYRKTVNDILEYNFNSTSIFSYTGTEIQKHFYVVLASDDPTVYESIEFSESLKAQAYITLATKTAIENTKRTGKSKDKKHWTEEDFGWEGGFFAPMFWNLGISPTGARASIAPHEKRVINLSAETVRMRIFLGRAYMMDLAVLARCSDAVVCAVSAMGCRLLAVMMGWHSAIERGNWVNIDGGYGWTGFM